MRYQAVRGPRTVRASEHPEGPDVRREKFKQVSERGGDLLIPLYPLMHWMLRGPLLADL